MRFCSRALVALVFLVAQVRLEDTGLADLGDDLSSGPSLSAFKGDYAFRGCSIKGSSRTEMIKNASIISSRSEQGGVESPKCSGSIVLASCGPKAFCPHSSETEKLE